MQRVLQGHSAIFWATIIISLLAGIYGLIAGQMVIFIPYTFINPLALFGFSALFPNRRYKHALELFASLILLVNVPGSIYFHSLGIQYDIPLHFITSFFAFEIVTLFASLKSGRRWVILLGSFALVVLGGVAFELYQKLVDVLFGTHLFSDAVQPIAIDATIDILMNVAGALTGLLLGLKKILFLPPLTPASLRDLRSGRDRGE